MTKPFSETDFSTQITQDRLWRIREISDLRSAVVKADDQLRRVLLRALITICYAHWEGYIRFAGRKYLEHIALRKFRYVELDRQFMKNYFLPRLGTLSNSNVSLVERCTLIDKILGASDRRFSRVNIDLINTKANLNFEVFTDICLVCSVPTDTFIHQATFIDILLLKRRNAIAHGEDTFVAISDLEELTNETVALMRTFGDVLENHIYQKTYRAA